MWFSLKYFYYSRFLNRSLKDYEINPKLNRSELDKLRFNKLKSLLNYAYFNVPFYRKLWDSYGISYEIESLAKWVAYYSGFESDAKGVIVVDNFYKDPDFIREWAIKEIEFSPSNYHKGERAIKRFSIIGMKEKLEQIIGKPIYNWNYDAYANGIFQFCTADQPIVYHVDNQTYAGIVFLTPDAPPQTGTAFYRSKVTGDYKFDDEKRQTINYVRAFQGKSAEMNFYDGTNFEKIECFTIDHKTPFETIQNFIFCSFNKK